jgi:perosamine synthetase
MTAAARARLAVDGGAPVRDTPLPYGRHWIDEEDIEAVCTALRSDWLTTGPKVEEYERAFATAVGSREAVAVSSGTAALHAAMYAIGIGPGDEVIVPPLTFAATANSVVFQRGTPVFADVDGEALLLDPDCVEARIGDATRAIVAVDYAGQPCDYTRLRAIAERHGIALVADACHALGAAFEGSPVGTLADLNTFSTHPVKHIATGEGGAVTTDRAQLAERMRIFRNHGISADHRERERRGSWHYEMVDLGYNYRLTDLQCALGIAQLAKLSGFVERRRRIAARYDAAFAELEAVTPLRALPGRTHAHHLYVVRLDTERLTVGRTEIFAAYRAEGIGVSVHFVPVHLHPFYRKQFETHPGLCPNAEAAYEQILSLPIFPRMSDGDAADVIRATEKIIAAYSK